MNAPDLTIARLMDAAETLDALCKLQPQPPQGAGDERPLARMHLTLALAHRYVLEISTHLMSGADATTALAAAARGQGESPRE